MCMFCVHFGGTLYIFFNQEPKTQIALRNKDLILSCRAASTSPADMTFTWKKDNKVLQLSDCESGNRYSCCFGLTPFLL